MDQIESRIAESQKQGVFSGYSFQGAASHERLKRFPVQLISSTYLVSRLSPAGAIGRD